MHALFLRPARRPALAVSLLVCLLAVAACAGQTAGANLSGVVADPAGRPIAGATLRALDAAGRTVAVAASDRAGLFRFTAPASATAVRVSRPGFLARTLPLAEVARGQTVLLAVAPLRQTVIVAATGTPVPREQLPMAASVITRAQLQAQQPLTLAGALRLTPGLSMLVSGQVGAITTPALRGGDPQFIKILLDGVPLQRFDFGSYILSALLPSDLQEVQVVRGPDSVIHGSDAVSGVIDLHSRTGADVPAPEFEAEAVGGAYATLEQNDRLLGAWRHGDYALSFAHLGTHNQVPNAKYRAQNYGGDFGFDLPHGWRLRAVARRVFSASGEPSTIDFYGLADNSIERQGETYQRYTLAQQATPAWSNRLAVSQGIVGYFFTTPAAVGIPVTTPFGAATVGLPVRIQGANGFSVTGQAILDGSDFFPAVTTFHTLRRDVDWQSVLALAPQWNLVAGYRYDNENGVGSFQAPLSRHDNGLFAHLSGGWGDRLFASAGASEDWDTPFGQSFNPQAGLVWLARRDAGGWWGATRLRASAGAALQDPNLFQQASSLDLILTAAGRSDLIAAHGIGPARPQRARSGDIGVDQDFASGRLRLSLTAFDARYFDLIEFVPQSGLLQLGVAPSVAQAVGNTYGGADVNSLAEEAKGLEAGFEARTGPLRLGAAYTLQDARVRRSLSSDALFPTINPAFPDIPIGAFAPLVGARPFRVPRDAVKTHLAWTGGKGTLAASFWWEGRRDDSTFLSDASFGPSLLLPNHDLEPAFARLNVSGYVPVRRGVTLEAAFENLLDDRVSEVIGYPAPGFTVRAGVRFTWPLARR